MRTFLLSLPVAPMCVGEVHQTLPLQCTLFQYFRTREPFDTVTRELRMICEKSPPIALTAGRPALFGKECDIPVHRVLDSLALSTLHFDILKFLKEIGAEILDPEWSGDGYKPHVTTSNGYAFPPGTTVVADRVYLIEKLREGGKKIVSAFPFE